MWGPQRSVVTACFGIAILSSCVNAFAPHCSSVRHSKFTISNKPDHSPFPQRIHGENQPHRCSRLLASKSEPVPGFGDDGCALPSPSKVNTLPLPAQAAVFFGIWLGLYGGTAALVAGIDALKHSYPDFMASWMTSWPLLGPMFMAAGLSHFSMKEGFENMMPVQGAWGFWYLPGSKSFHVAWTGVVEFLAGLWLTIGGTSNLIFGISLPDAFELGSGSIIADASLVLLLLTIAVTPANIYMFTHGATLPPVAVEPIPIAGHAARGVLQCLLFAIFYTMAIPSIYHLQTLSV